MWHTNSLWFEIAVVMSIFAVGNILLGHFEDHKPKWQRLLKVINLTVIFVCLSLFLGRAWTFGFLTLLLLGATIIHAWWLPKHGINGWTAEPKDKYYALIKAKRQRKSKEAFAVATSKGFRAQPPPAQFR